MMLVQKTKDPGQTLVKCSGKTRVLGVSYTVLTHVFKKKKKNLSLYPKLAAQFSKTFIRTSINTISDHRHL